VTHPTARRATRVGRAHLKSKCRAGAGAALRAATSCEETKRAGAQKNSTDHGLFQGVWFVLSRCQPIQSRPRRVMDNASTRMRGAAFNGTFRTAQMAA
jgi:hypothetical protein